MLKPVKKTELRPTVYGFRGGWELSVHVDGDMHINLYLTNLDGTDIHEVDTGQGNGKDGEQMALRFTTDGIEDFFQRTGEPRNDD